jgi:hypothetical protein
VGEMTADSGISPAGTGALRQGELPPRWRSSLSLADDARGAGWAASATRGPSRSLSQAARRRPTSSLTPIRPFDHPRPPLRGAAATSPVRVAHLPAVVGSDEGASRTSPTDRNVTTNKESNK